MKRLNKKGASATGILIIVLLVVLAVVALFINLNWKRFKAEANYGFTIAVIIVLAVFLVYVIIRHKIRKAKKAKAKKAEQERLERERINKERIANGEEPLPESTLGNGKLELSDVTEVAGKVTGKVGEALKKDE